MPKHATSTSFQKGKSGNPAGPPTKNVIERARSTLQEFLPQAFGHLQAMFDAKIDREGHSEPDMATRERAMHIVFDRNLGKMVEKKEISGADGGAIKIEDNTPSIRLLLTAALPPLIEGEKE